MTEENQSLINWAQEVIKEQKSTNPEIFDAIEIVKSAQKGIDVYNEYLAIINQPFKITITVNKTNINDNKSN